MVDLKLDKRTECIIGKNAGLNKQGTITFIQHLIVNALKNEYSPEVYEELNLKYSKTLDEQISERNLKVALAEEKEDKKTKDGRGKASSLR
jgi:predicted fused transcriptional regulator/phosphomethylpyrimidine kinase